MTSESDILEDILKNQKPIDAQIQFAEQELAALDKKRKKLQERIKQLKWQKQSIADEQLSFDRLLVANVTNESTQEHKIALFRSLFRGREDVFPRRFESKRSGKSGYQPACRNEWIRPICQKPKIKCGECENRDFMPLSNDVIRNHLIGIDPTDRYQREFVIGVYPMLLDETCRFMAVDFDKEEWKENSKAYLETCETFNVSAVLERSRSGNGGHIWIFFSEPIPAKLARQLGAFMLINTMETRPEMGFNSYDRFFPSQDTLPRGGFGSLIALPLQAKTRGKDNSLFVDEYFSPYSDQWRFLSAVRRMHFAEVQSVVDQAAYRGGVLGVPKTVDEAVKRLIANMPLKFKVDLSKMDEGELINLHFTFGAFFRNQFGLWSGNEDLLNDCRQMSGITFMNPDDAAAFIIEKLWKRLRKTHQLRVVK